MRRILLQVLLPLLLWSIQADAQQAKLLRGPYLQSATPNSILIRWRTDVATRSRVSYGTIAGRPEKTISDVTLVTEHMVRLDGLQPGTRYYYTIGGLKDTLQGGNDNYFSSLPRPGSKGHYRIGIFGDCGDLTIHQRNVRDAFRQYLGKHDLNAWILLGDNAYNDGTDAEYQAKFFNIYKDDLLKKYPLYPAPGNHDYHDADFTAAYAQQHHTTAYYQNFSMPIKGEAGGEPSHNPAFYAFDIGNIHFLSLDSYGKEENQYYLYDTAGPQVQWVKKDLAANNNKDWVVVYWHHPPYSMGTHNADTDGNMRRIRENFIRILEEAGVDLVICGHSHVYERSRPLNGHYGKEATFNASRHALSSSSGAYDGTTGSAPYIRNDSTKKGTVYVVSGSSSSVGKPEASFPHDAMQYSNADITGAALLEVQENRLDFKWICEDGVIRDQFTMMKNVNKHTVIRLKEGQSTTLTASYVGHYKWSNGASGRSITVTPPVGPIVFSVHDEHDCLKDTFSITVADQ
ncbi:metallophosphoesterase family protein [Chitinophaga sp. G-6-1-13]|uniref:Metallophosphoesterase family protein n=1 Tax=Chitinophaga fulva TaxID=2728842 RepID=A0A848GNG6_9BACT|nr:metallophosphoesterase family protein [Chitinophaga fulva]NML40016.1 metallophosphoesterase family protein [Chitinophaga fulva]